MSLQKQYEQLKKQYGGDPRFKKIAAEGIRKGLFHDPLPSEITGLGSPALKELPFEQEKALGKKRQGTVGPLPKGYKSGESIPLGAEKGLFGADYSLPPEAQNGLMAGIARTLGSNVNPFTPKSSVQRSGVLGKARQFAESPVPLWSLPLGGLATKALGPTALLGGDAIAQLGKAAPAVETALRAAQTAGKGALAATAAVGAHQQGVQAVKTGMEGDIGGAIVEGGLAALLGLGSGAVMRSKRAPNRLEEFRSGLSATESKRVGTLADKQLASIAEQTAKRQEKVAGLNAVQQERAATEASQNFAAIRAEEQAAYRKLQATKASEMAGIERQAQGKLAVAKEKAGQTPTTPYKRILTEEQAGRGGAKKVSFAEGDLVNSKFTATGRVGKDTVEVAGTGKPFWIARSKITTVDRVPAAKVKPMEGAPGPTYPAKVAAQQQLEGVIDPSAELVTIGGRKSEMMGSGKPRPEIPASQIGKVQPVLPKYEPATLDPKVTLVKKQPKPRPTQLGGLRIRSSTSKKPVSRMTPEEVSAELQRYIEKDAATPENPKLLQNVLPKAERLERMKKLEGLSAEAGLEGVTDADLIPLVTTKVKSTVLDSWQRTISRAIPQDSPLYRLMRLDENEARIQNKKATHAIKDTLRKTMPDLVKDKKLSALVMELGEQAGGKPIDLEVAAQGLSRIGRTKVLPQRVVDLDKRFRDGYNHLIDQANAERAKLGLKPITRREDYYTHMRDVNDIVQMWDDRVVNIEAGGVSKAVRNPFARPRTGSPTKMDALNAFDVYNEVIQREIAFNRQVQRLTKLANGMEKRYGKSDPLTSQLQVAMKRQAQDISGDLISLAEDVATNRDFGKAFRVLGAMKSRQGSNALSWNPSAILVQGANIPIGITRTGYYNFAKAAIEQVIAGATRSGTLQAEAPHLASKYLMTPRIRRSISRKFGEFGFELLGAFERQTTETIYRALKHTAKVEGRKNPTQWAQEEIELMVGGRDLGQMPPFIADRAASFFSQFMNEVNASNKYLIEGVGKGVKGRERLLRTAKYVTSAWLVNQAYQQLIGRSPLADPLQTTRELIDIQREGNDTLTTGLKMGGRVAGEVLGQIPGASFLADVTMPDWARKAWLGKTEMGRYGSGIAAFSSVKDLAAAAARQSSGNTEGAKQSLRRGVLKVAPPFGGAALNKLMDKYEGPR